jgi:hypothetical protein
MVFFFSNDNISSFSYVRSTEFYEKLPEIWVPTNLFKYPSI